jgi:hypothetical protein
VHDGDLAVTVPKPPTGTRWLRVLDTAQGFDLAVEGGEEADAEITVEARSNVVLISKSVAS